MRNVLLLLLAIPLLCRADLGSFLYHGQTYKTIKIGSQTWMAENLNYNASGSKCYGNLESNCDKYGRLYNWETAMSACPSGWHLPTNAEWDALYRHADGTSGTGSPYDSETAGKHLKAASGWYDNGNGLDSYGFAALPGGYGASGGSFYDAGYFCYWWSASEDASYGAYDRYMYYYGEIASWDFSSKTDMDSVRCVRD